MKKRKKTKMEKRKIFYEWLRLVCDDKEGSEFLVCPRCKEKAVDYIYIGDKKSMIGYLQTWCNSCKYRIYISRVIMPEGLKTRDFKDDMSDLPEIIPEFKLFNPY
ncbi:hypothetical protein [Sebaldella sp. S0638]|uniref:hypothetical protein n=1 Tax=Sebaldella sp. S0638 TaxID=2957809 RepID=UPI00209D520C|nr:hypothetical protein [Sebaldella sp. S0638]MCP1226593.1 hypothetical protein [Sebaldella sp. S0638]